MVEVAGVPALMLMPVGIAVIAKSWTVTVNDAVAVLP
jgi:hypothetical protein